jgi:hypothetical protein
MCDGFGGLGGIATSSVFGDSFESTIGSFPNLFFALHEPIPGLFDFKSPNSKIYISNIKSRRYLSEVTLILRIFYIICFILLLNCTSSRKGIPINIG